MTVHVQNTLPYGPANHHSFLALLQDERTVKNDMKDREAFHHMASPWNVDMDWNVSDAARAPFGRGNDSPTDISSMIALRLRMWCPNRLQSHNHIFDEYWSWTCMGK
jgi:hypothetical protein